MNDGFQIFGWEFKKSTKDEQVSAPYIEPTKDDAAFVVDDYFYGFSQYHLNLDYSFASEDELIRKYREMSMYPEVDAAITDIVNEAISGDNESSPVDIVLDDLELSEKIKNKIRTEFEYIVSLLNFNNEAYEIFRKWYVDARIYYHVIIGKNGIEELRYMSPLCTKKIREQKRKIDTKSGIDILAKVDEYYLYTRNPIDGASGRGTRSQTIKLTADSVVAATSGLYDETNNRIYSYLHKAIKPANQLKMLEDAIVIYRLSRAPERRVFYVDVGRMPRQKAEEYLKAVKNRHTNKMSYDATTGEVKDSASVLSMMEDYWMPRMEGGRSTEVTTLGGAVNLGEISDIEYFQKKLYMSLNVPFGRISQENASPFTIGRSQEITRDELKFSKYIARLRKKFSNIFYELLKRQLVLKKIISEDEWETIKEGITFNFLSDNNYKELKEAELLRERINTLREVENYVGTYFSKEYVRKNILKQTDEEIEQLKSEREKEAEEEPDPVEPGMEGAPGAGGETPSLDTPNENGEWEDV